MNKKIFFIITSIFLLSACNFKQVGGTLGGVVGNHIGGKLGKNVGNSLGKTLISTTGTLVGAWLGSEFGKKLDEESYRRMEENTQYTLENNVDGDAGNWENPNNNADGSVEVEKTVYIEELKTSCRDYIETVSVSGQTKKRNATACRDDGGKWKDKT